MLINVILIKKHVQNVSGNYFKEDKRKILRRLQSALHCSLVTIRPAFSRYEEKEQCLITVFLSYQCMMLDKNGLVPVLKGVDLRTPCKQISRATQPLGYETPVVDSITLLLDMVCIPRYFR